MEFRGAVTQFPITGVSKIQTAVGLCTPEDEMAAVNRGLTHELFPAMGIAPLLLGEGFR